MSNRWGVYFLYRCLTYEGMGALFRALVVLFGMLAIFTYDMINARDTVSALSAYLGCFCQRIFFFPKNWLDKLPWNSFLSDLYTKLRTIIRGAPGVATDYFCAVWDRGINLLPFVWWPTFSCSLFEKAVGVYVLQIGEEFSIDSFIHVLHITKVLLISFLLKWFYSEIIF